MNSEEIIESLMMSKTQVDNKIILSARNSSKIIDEIVNLIFKEENLN